MITNHQFLKKYSISLTSKKSIIGTIHPHNHLEFTIPFFYGNVMSIWKILQTAFPEELTKPLSLKKILLFLESREISVSDTIVSCSRLTNSALDKDLVPIELNSELVDQIKSSTINHLLFTSGFGKNNAFQLFYKGILGRKISSAMRKSREFYLDEDVFGRPMKVTILFSPSGSANTGISKSKEYLQKKENYVKSETPVKDFRVDYYRDKFTK